MSNQSAKVFSPTWLLIVALIVAAGIAALFFLKPLIHSADAIKIGVIVAQSGPAAQHEVFVDAMQLAAEEINDEGGINGRKLELIVRDNQTDPETGEKLFAEIERQYHPLLYISSTSVVSMRLAPIAEKTKVVLAGLAVADPNFTKAKKWVFRYTVSAKEEAEPILEILQKLDVKNLGVIYQNDSFGTSYYATLKKVGEENGIQIVGEPFSDRNPEFKPIIAKLKNIEAIYICGFVNVVAQGIKQLRSDSYQGYILTYSGANGLRHTMPELNNIYLTAPIIYNDSFVFAQEVKKRFEAKYNAPFSHQAASGYDFLKIIAGLLDGQEISRENLRDLMEKGFSYPSIFGFIEKKAGDHDIAFPLYPARIVDGKLHYLK